MAYSSFENYKKIYKNVDISKRGVLSTSLKRMVETLNNATGSRLKVSDVRKMGLDFYQFIDYVEQPVQRKRTEYIKNLKDNSNKLAKLNKDNFNKLAKLNNVYHDVQENAKMIEKLRKNAKTMRDKIEILKLQKLNQNRVKAILDGDLNESELTEISNNEIDMLSSTPDVLEKIWERFEQKQAIKIPKNDIDEKAKLLEKYMTEETANYFALYMASFEKPKKAFENLQDYQNTGVESEYFKCLMECSVELLYKDGTYKVLQLTEALSGKIEVKSMWHIIDNIRHSTSVNVLADMYGLILECVLKDPLGYKIIENALKKELKDDLILISAHH